MIIGTDSEFSFARSKDSQKKGGITVKEKRELLETNRQLHDEQLEQVGGGIRGSTLCYGYCNECGWKSAIVRADRVKNLTDEHTRQTGHSDVCRRIA